MGFIDEIQKVPSLLDEVHRLIEEKIFVSSSQGQVPETSTAGVNLLAGRALTHKIFPFGLYEIHPH